MRRYVAGYSLISDALFEEATCGGLGPEELKRLLRRLSALLDQLLVAVSAEFEREAGDPATPERCRIELVRRLLDGELLDSSELAYDLDAYHLALVASGPGGMRRSEMSSAITCCWSAPTGPRPGGGSGVVTLPTRTPSFPWLGT